MTAYNSYISFWFSGENVGLDTKYLKKREDSIPLRGLNQNTSQNTGKCVYIYKYIFIFN